MSTESDPLRRDLERLRRIKGLCPLTPEEADAALAAAPDTPLSEDEIERLLSAATSGEASLQEPVPEQEWDPDREAEGIDEEVLRLNRPTYNTAVGFAGFAGHTHTEDTRRKISKASQGRPASELCRLKSSQRARERNLTNPPRKGKRCSEEHRRKLSEAQKAHQKRLREGRD